MKKSGHGFTIVELVITIAVIAILAAVTVSSYNAVQVRARDAQRVSDISQLKKAMDTWVMRSDTLPHSSGAGYNAEGSGWVSSSSYAQTYENIFLSQKLIPNEIRDPQTPTGTGSYMFYRCNSTSEYYTFLARLENPSEAKDNEHSRWTGMGCSGQTTYGMNYARIMRYAG